MIKLITKTFLFLGLSLTALTACFSQPDDNTPDTVATPQTATVQPAHAETKETVVRQALATLFPGREPDKLSASAFPGWHEVIYGTELFYISADGRYLMQGDVFDLKEKINITEHARKDLRLAFLKNFPQENLIIYKPEKTRHVVHVFTDIDCGYCRKMHNQLKDYLAAGIEFRYILFPRTGANTSSYYKAVSVWCSDDRQQSLTIAKQGIVLPNRECDNPIKENIAAANSMGVTGTPTLIFANGESVPGYLPPQQLIEVLEQQTAGHASL